MNISNYISELLFEQECVIIPGFGGVVANYKGADIHPTLGTIAPPSKSISFNKLLVKNDGLLINHLAQQEHLSFEAATEKVQEWVLATKNQLKRNEEIILAGIGRLANDIEHHLQFFPDHSINYLRSSFGLKTIHAEPILRGKLKQESTPVVPIQKHRTVHAKPAAFNRWAAVIVFLFISGSIAALIFSSQQSTDTLHNTFFAGCFDSLFHSMKRGDCPSTPILSAIDTPKKDSVTQVATLAIDTVPKVDSVAKSVSAPVESNPIKSLTDKGYYIVVGAFGEQGHVEEMAEKLKSEFPNQPVLIEPHGRLIRVGYFVSQNHEEAMTKLAEAKQENKDYWLYTKQ